MKANRFRFRAWDNKLNKWISGPQPEKDDLFIEETDGAYEVTSWSQVTLMQSTGLCDKNGKEIFEGDILGEIACSSEGSLLDWSTWKVICKDAAFYYIPLVPADHHEDDWDGYLLGDDTLRRHPVIGNIYEHPHLLEAANE